MATYTGLALGGPEEGQIITHWDRVYKCTGLLSKNVPFSYYGNIPDMYFHISLGYSNEELYGFWVHMSIPREGSAYLVYLQNRFAELVKFARDRTR